MNAMSSEMELQRIALDDERWIALISTQQDALPFHHPNWAAAIGDAYGFPTFALAFIARTGEVIGGLPTARSHGLSLVHGDGCRFRLPTTAPRLLPDGYEARDVESALDLVRERPESSHSKCARTWRPVLPARFQSECGMSCTSKETRLVRPRC